VIDARAAATISGRGERQLIRDTNDNQKLLARGTNRDDLALAIGRRPSILIAAAVSPRLTRYKAARIAQVKPLGSARR
jgi:hypothetical protein